MNKTSLRCYIDRLIAGPVIGLAIALTATTPTATAGDDHQEGRDAIHYVYTLDNAQVDNRVVVLKQRPDGALVQAGSVSTGGAGTGAGLGSQGALALSKNGRWLFAVSAASNQITTFSVHDGKLRPASVVSSGGLTPISVTSHGKLVYVLNAGGMGSITGFELGNHGDLAPIPGSTQGLGGSATGPAQIAFAKDGDFLVVSQKAANQLAVYALDDGVAQPATLSKSSGNVPFGFDIDRRGHVIVSEAAASTVSSYELGDVGDLSVITASAQTFQGAACWLILTPNGRYAYTGNAATSTITGFGVTRQGKLKLLVPSGESASTGAGSHTLDLATSANGNFLYALANVGQSVTAFRIGADGSLVQTGQFTGVPTSAAGLVAR